MRYTTQHAVPSDTLFVLAAARAIWTEIWLEQNADTLPAGAYIDDYVPETPVQSLEEARHFVQRVLSKAQKGSVDALLTEWRKRWSPDADPPYSPACAGWYAAMEAMGHGVGLFRFGVQVDLPYLEPTCH